MNVFGVEHAVLYTYLYYMVDSTTLQLMFVSFRNEIIIRSNILFSLCALITQMQTIGNAIKSFMGDIFLLLYLP